MAHRVRVLFTVMERAFIVVCLFAERRNVVKFVFLPARLV